MDTRFAVDLLSPVSLDLVGVLAAAVFLLFVLGRWAVGRPTAIARRWSLFAIRALIVLTLLAILANPVRIDESSAGVKHPKVLCLLDTSESMALGNPTSRFEKAVQTLDRTGELLPINTRLRLSTYRFGRRLSAVESSDDGSPYSTLAPIETDTQLQSALRQLPGRFGRTPPASVVLLSDGQARDPAAVAEIAGRYAAMDVPIHVLLLGDARGVGDVAIITMIAPARVRKFSQVNVQVFVRSFGYDGRRTEVLLSDIGADGEVRRRLNRLPITLRDGVQSFHLTFQSEMRPIRLQSSIPLLSDEVASNNNTFDADVAVDRSKIRVLHVDGTGRVVSMGMQNLFGKLSRAAKPLWTDEALSSDPDIECNAFDASRQTPGFRSLNSGSSVTFPRTVAELFAYDVIVLCNVPRRAFGDEQLDLIEKWIAERGGGLCMVGGPQSFAGGGWRDTGIGKMLPVVMQSADADWRGDDRQDVHPDTAGPLHPVWNIVSNKKQNLAILGTFPKFRGANRFVREKPAATVLAVADSLDAENNGLPVIAVAPFGKGRTMAIATQFTAASTEQWGESDNRYYAKFWRNAIYWLTENSSIGRRRLVAATDKMLYRPGETIQLRAETYDEGANRTMDYRVDVMIEPQSGALDLGSDFSAVCWPNGVQRTGGEGPCIAWGEEFEMSAVADRKEFAVELPVSEDQPAGSASQALRIELSAYEDFALVDSTSIDIQILDDPFEQQNPLPNLGLLRQVASLSGGQTVSDAESLAAVIEDLPGKVSPPVVRKTPLWSRWWLLSVLLLLLTTEWIWRRVLGLA